MYRLRRALKFLEDKSDQNRFLMLHFMDMHLPYTEPLSYRYLFAGERPDALKTDGFLRSDVVRAAKKLGKEAKQHVVDRYDNNLRYLDDVLSDFLAQLPEDTIVAIFADHGEEFWDHNDFEHGHTFYDELLKVPFIVKSPDLEPGTYDDPISLLDLAPPMVRAAGLSDMSSTDGWAIQDLERKDFASRPLAFGRPLYGDDGWASLYGDNKYIVRSGKESMYDLSTDEVEKINTLRGRSQGSRMASKRHSKQRWFPHYASSSATKKRARSHHAAQTSTPIEYAWRGTDPANGRMIFSMRTMPYPQPGKSHHAQAERSSSFPKETSRTRRQIKGHAQHRKHAKDLLPNPNLNWPPPLKLMEKV